MAKVEYAWKQAGQKKSEWFLDKTQCLNHCKEHKTEGHVYLYKRLLIPNGWLPYLVKTAYQSFRWKVKAYWGVKERRHEPAWTLKASPWFDNHKNCLRHFKDMLQEGYDVVDCWGTRHYLVMRRLLGQRKRLLCLKHDKPLSD